MAIKFGNIVISSNVLKAPCPGQFLVSVVVNGIENGLGGTYDVRLFDDDIFPNPDDILDQALGVAVPAGTGRFANIHRFTLSCTQLCEVVGAVGPSGEACAEVYAFVRETRPNGNRNSSNIIQLCCIEEDECVVVAAGDAPASDAAITLSAPPGTVPASTLVRVQYGADAPDVQYFGNEVDVRVRRVAIGDPALAFSQPLSVTWRLSKTEAGLLKDLDGRVVRFDQQTQTWSPIPFDFTGRAVTFAIGSGGMYGIAGHARFSEICYTSEAQPPGQ